MGEAKNIYFTCLKANFQKDFVPLYPTTRLIQDAERSRRIRRPLHSQKMLRFQQDHRSRRSCIRADQHRYGGREDGPNDGREQDVRRLRQFVAWARVTTVSSASPRKTAFFHPTFEENSPDQECLTLSIRYLRSELSRCFSLKSFRIFSLQNVRFLVKHNLVSYFFSR